MYKNNHFYRYFPKIRKKKHFKAKKSTKKHIKKWLVKKKHKKAHVLFKSTLYEHCNRSTWEFQFLSFPNLTIRVRPFVTQNGVFRSHVFLNKNKLLARQCIHPCPRHTFCPENNHQFCVSENEQGIAIVLLESRYHKIIGKKLGCVLCLHGHDTQTGGCGVTICTLLHGLAERKGHDPKENCEQRPEMSEYSPWASSTTWTNERRQLACAEATRCPGQSPEEHHGSRVPLCSPCQDRSQRMRAKESHRIHPCTSRTPVCDAPIKCAFIYDAEVALKQWWTQCTTSFDAKFWGKNVHLAHGWARVAQFFFIFRRVGVGVDWRSVLETFAGGKVRRTCVHSTAHVAKQVVYQSSPVCYRKYNLRVPVWFAVKFLPVIRTLICQFSKPPLTLHSLPRAIATNLANNSAFFLPGRTHHEVHTSNQWTFLRRFVSVEVSGHENSSSLNVDVRRCPRICSFMHIHRYN